MNSQMLEFRHSVHHAARANVDHQDHQVHQALMELMEHQAMQVILDHQVMPCQHQTTTSRSSPTSARVKRQRDQPVTQARKANQEIQATPATQVDQAPKAPQASPVMLVNQDHQSLWEVQAQQVHRVRQHQALADQKVHQANQDPKVPQAHQVRMEQPERTETTAHQDQTAIRASPAHQVNPEVQVPQAHPVMLVHQAHVITVHQRVSHQDIKLQANDLFGMDKNRFIVDYHNAPRTILAIVILLKTSPRIYIS